MDATVTLKLRKIGGSVGIILPPEVLASMGVADGDTVFLTEMPGGYRITPHDPDVETEMSAARGIMNKRRSALRDLAR